MAVKAIVLAAGSGTRMKSQVPKVLHDIAGKPMIQWVLDALAGIDPIATAVVVQENAEAVVALIVEHWELSRDLIEYFVKPDPLAFEMAAVHS